MESSPKTSELPPSTASETPASGKKLLLPRLPFATLYGNKPPVSAQNDTSETALATSKTLTPVMDNRKSKQNASASEEDGLWAAKLNRSEYENSDVVVLETNEIMELSNGVPTGNGTESNTKTDMPSRKSESNENVCLDKSTVDEIELSDDSDEAESETNEPKAKQSLEQWKIERKEREEQRKRRIQLARGSRFALMEIKAFFFYLLLNFNLQPYEKTQIPIKIAKSAANWITERGIDLELSPRA